MSSCPGPTLEDWLEDNYYIHLGNPEDFKVPDCRVTFLTDEQFRGFVALFEHHREHVEHLIEDFDEDTQSWRAYNSSVFDFIDEDKSIDAQAYLKQFRS